MNLNENLHCFVQLPVETSPDTLPLSMVVSLAVALCLINLSICCLIRIDFDLGYFPTPLHHSAPVRGRSPQAVYVRS